MLDQFGDEYREYMNAPVDSFQYLKQVETISISPCASANLAIAARWSDEQADE